MTCKYYYRGGLCANSQMDQPFCVGEDNCELLKGRAPRQPKMSTIIVRDGKGPMEQWMGVYCPHYQRFFCTGGTEGCKTGSCATAEDYLNALKEHMEKSK